MPKQYWLMKSEPTCYSIDDLKRDKTTYWDGVRNYQARNFMRDQMKVGDGVLFYHSNANPPGVAGIAKITKIAYPDFTAWDEQDQHYDPKSSPQKPIWFMVNMGFVKKFKEVISLEIIKNTPPLEGIMVARKGSRLSIQPLSQQHFQYIQKMASS
jgi:predicted RNA-binding protein with PUA-like domain